MYDFTSREILRSRATEQTITVVGANGAGTREEEFMCLYEATTPDQAEGPV